MPYSRIKKINNRKEQVKLTPKKYDKTFYNQESGDSKIVVGKDYSNEIESIKGDIKDLHKKIESIDVETPIEEIKTLGEKFESTNNSLKKTINERISKLEQQEPSVTVGMVNDVKKYARENRKEILNKADKLHYHDEYVEEEELQEELAKLRKEFKKKVAITGHGHTNLEYINSLTGDVQTTTSNITITSQNDVLYVCDITNNNITVTIPSSVIVDKLSLSIKKVVDSEVNLSQGSLYNVTITTDDTGTFFFNVDGRPTTSYTIETTGQTVSLLYNDGSNTFYAK